MSNEEDVLKRCPAKDMYFQCVEYEGHQSFIMFGKIVEHNFGGLGPFTQEDTAAREEYRRSHMSKESRIQGLRSAALYSMSRSDELSEPEFIHMAVRFAIWIETGTYKVPQVIDDKPEGDDIAW